MVCLWRCAHFESIHFQVRFLMWAKEVGFQLFKNNTVSAAVRGCRSGEGRARWKQSFIRLQCQHLAMMLLLLWSCPDVGYRDDARLLCSGNHVIGFQADTTLIMPWGPALCFQHLVFIMPRTEPYPSTKWTVECTSSSACQRHERASCGRIQRVFLFTCYTIAYSILCSLVLCLWCLLLWGFLLENQISKY